MLGSRNKKDDPLAAEFIRTFRVQNFHGKFYLDYYASLKSGRCLTKSLPMPRKGQQPIEYDEVSAYGYRPPDPDLFYLSPWEFVQWYKVHRVREPSKDYDWSKRTAAGQRKLERRKAGEKVVMMPYIDFVLHEKNIKQLSYLYQYPDEKLMFAGKAPEGYTQFRHTWLLIRRERPAVPCPVQTPLPGKRMSKETRAEMFSVYLRPWTLAGKVASGAVPHLANLADVGATLQHGMDEEGEAATTSKCIRKAWKAYTHNLLPHAARQISNFMLACLAEGRGRDRDDEDAFKRGGALTCVLTSDEITDSSDE